jgi:hypothetical protein
MMPSMTYGHQFPTTSIDPSRFQQTSNLVTFRDHENLRIELQPELATLENLDLCGTNCHLALHEFLLIQVNNLLNNFLVGESLIDQEISNDRDSTVDVSGWNLPKLREISLHLDGHLNTNLSLFKSVLDDTFSSSILPISIVANEICESINALHFVRSNLTSTTKQFEFGMSDLTNTKLNEISSLLVKDFAEFYSFVVLVGSYGSKEEIPGVSDVDLFGCIKTSVLQDSQKLIELRRLTPSLIKLIQTLDKNQHHGIISITEQMLDMYPNAFFPLETLGRGELVFSSVGKIEASQLASNYSALHQVISVRQHFRSLFLDGFEIDSEYFWKYSVGLYLLFPTLFLQCSGEFRFKGDTFEPYKRIVAMMDSPISEAERIRQDAYSLKGIYSNRDRRRVLFYRILCEIETLTTQAIETFDSQDFPRIDFRTREFTPVLLEPENSILENLKSLTSDFFFFGNKDFSKVRSDIDWGMFYANNDHDSCGDKVKNVYAVFQEFELDDFQPAFHFNRESEDKIGLIFPFLNFDTKYDLKVDPTDPSQRPTSAKRDMAMEIILSFALTSLKDLALNSNSKSSIYSAAKSAYYLSLTLGLNVSNDFIADLNSEMSQLDPPRIKHMNQRILDMFAIILEKLSENSSFEQDSTVKVLAIYADQYFVVNNWNSSLFWFYFNLSIAKTGKALYVLPSSFMTILNYFDSEFSGTTWSYEVLILDLQNESLGPVQSYDLPRAEAVKTYLIDVESCPVQDLRTLPFMPTDLQRNWNEAWKAKYLDIKTKNELHEVFERALNEFDFAVRASKLRMLIDKEFNSSDLRWVLDQLNIEGNAELKYLMGVYLQGVQEFYEYEVIFCLYSESESEGFDPFWIDYNRHFLHLRIGDVGEAIGCLSKALAHLYGRQDPFYVNKYQEVKEKLSSLR